MTVWKIVRGAWTVVSLPFVAIATLNIERIAQAHRLDQIVPDPAQKLSYFSTLAQQPWVVFLSVLIFGVTIGLWTDSVLRGLLTRGIPSRKDKLALLGHEMQDMLHRINHVRNFSYSHETKHQARLLSADMNVLMTNVARMGIPVPLPSTSIEAFEDYLARVGARLIAGDEAAATVEATR